MVLSALIFGYLMKPTGSSSGNYTGIEPDLVGKRGVVIADVSPTGKVLVDGQEWTATTKIGDVILEKEEVTVMGVYGTGVLVVSTQPSEIEFRSWLSFGKLLRGGRTKQP